MKKDPYYYEIGAKVLVNWEGEWREAKIVNSYRTHDGLINVELLDGNKIWFGEQRHEEFIKPVLNTVEKLKNN